MRSDSQLAGDRERLIAGQRDWRLAAVRGSAPTAAAARATRSPGVARRLARLVGMALDATNAQTAPPVDGTPSP
jgi:hypothetical protein